MFDGPEAPATRADFWQHIRDEQDRVAMQAYRERQAARCTYCPHCPIKGTCLICKASHDTTEE